jgi:hypothetical protein
LHAATPVVSGTQAVPGGQSPSQVGNGDRSQGGIGSHWQAWPAGSNTQVSPAGQSPRHSGSGASVHTTCAVAAPDHANTTSAARRIGRREEQGPESGLRMLPPPSNRASGSGRWHPQARVRECGKCRMTLHGEFDLPQTLPGISPGLYAETGKRIVGIGSWLYLATFPGGRSPSRPCDPRSTSGSSTTITIKGTRFSAVPGTRDDTGSPGTPWTKRCVVRRRLEADPGPARGCFPRSGRRLSCGYRGSLITHLWRLESA